MLLLSPSSNIQESTQNQALTTSFIITPNSLFMTIWWCTISLLIPAFNKDKGKAVPVCTIKVCVLMDGCRWQRCCCIRITGTESRLRDGWIRKGGFDTWHRQEGFLLSLPFVLALWPTHILCNGYTIKQRTGLTMHHHLVPMCNTGRLSGAISVSSFIFLVWCIVKHRNNLTLKYFTWNSTAPFRLPE